MKTIEIYLHGSDIKPRVARESATDTLRAVLARHEFNRGGDTQVFVGASNEALSAPASAEDETDTQVPADLDRTLEALDLHRHRHVHCYRCLRIAVVVNFGGGAKRRKFSPAATIEVVTQWARRRFGLDDAAADELVLQICGTNIRPRPDKHLGELREAADCNVCFDLVPEVTPQG